MILQDAVGPQVLAIVHGGEHVLRDIRTGGGRSDGLVVVRNKCEHVIELSLGDSRRFGGTGAIRGRVDPLDVAVGAVVAPVGTAAVASIDICTHADSIRGVEGDVVDVRARILPELARRNERSLNRVAVEIQERGLEPPLAAHPARVQGIAAIEGDEAHVVVEIGVNGPAHVGT